MRTRSRWKGQSGHQSSSYRTRGIKLSSLETSREGGQIPEGRDEGESGSVTGRTLWIEGPSQKKTDRLTKSFT